MLKRLVVIDFQLAHHYLCISKTATCSGLCNKPFLG